MESNNNFTAMPFDEEFILIESLFSTFTYKKLYNFMMQFVSIATVSFPLPNEQHFYHFILLKFLML